LFGCPDLYTYLDSELLMKYKRVRVAKVAAACYYNTALHCTTDVHGNGNDCYRPTTDFVGFPWETWNASDGECIIRI